MALTQAESTQPELGPDVENLILHFQPLPDSAGLRMTYRDATARRWEVPASLLGLRPEGEHRLQDPHCYEARLSECSPPECDDRKSS